MLVSTTLVSALSLRARLATAWPQLWKATRAMGISTFHVMSSRPDGGPKVTMAAAMAIRTVWKAKDAHSTQRRAGEKKRWKRAKTKEPTQKQASDVPDLTHRVDSRGAASPRPK